MSDATAGSARPERHRLTKVGRVTSDKMDKTVVVAVERLTAHKVYKRTVRRTKTFMAHDPTEQARIGDRVEIVEARPESKRKRWRVSRIIERAHGSQASRS